jgi:hypothetical protein
MSTGLAVVTEITNAHQHVWQVTLEVTFPPGAKAFKPGFLNSLGHRPQTISIPASDVLQRMLVTVLGKPEVQIGDAIAFEVAA